MSKLMKLLDWVTVPQAAKHLSAILNEEVTEADVLRLALDRRLTLSVKFVNHAKAHLGRVVPYKNAPKYELPPIRSDGQPGSEPFLRVDGFLFEDVDELAEETPIVCFEKAVTTLAGVWDLTMRGGERVDVEHRYQELTGGPAVELVDINGSFVHQDDGSWAQLLDRLPDTVVEGANGRKTIRGEYYPMSGLPEDAVLVVRTSALFRFQTELAAAEGKKREACAPLDGRSETTYLNIIGALLELVLGKTPAGKPQSVFKSQAAIIDALLAHHDDKPGISETTLEAKFADARRRLNST